MYGHILLRSRITGKRKRLSTFGRFAGAGNDVVLAHHLNVKGVSMCQLIYKISFSNIFRRKPEVSGFHLKFWKPEVSGLLAGHLYKWLSNIVGVLCDLESHKTPPKITE